VRSLRRLVLALLATTCPLAAAGLVGSWAQGSHVDLRLVGTVARLDLLMGGNRTAACSRPRHLLEESVTRRTRACQRPARRGPHRTPSPTPTPTPGGPGGRGRQGRARLAADQGTAAADLLSREPAHPPGHRRAGRRCPPAAPQGLRGPRPGPGHHPGTPAAAGSPGQTPPRVGPANPSSPRPTRGLHRSAVTSASAAVRRAVYRRTRTAVPCAAARCSRPAVSAAVPAPSRPGP